MDFKLESKFKPSGDQNEAIESLAQGLNDGLRSQVLLGVTGSGKTFTMANIIQKLQRPALVITHNKTLAAQLCNEFREFFPNNKVEYFVSYYDYYQPEAYVPQSDLYIEKELQINEEIDRLRNSATSSLCESRDVIVVASVSCIYGLGAPKDYFDVAISLRPNMQVNRNDLIMKLVELQYKRNDIGFDRCDFRVRGDYLEIYPASYNKIGIRVEYFDETIESISEFDVVTYKSLRKLKHVNIFPATQYIFDTKTVESTLENIADDLKEQVQFFKDNNKFIEAQRIEERVNYDIEMIREVGYCNGIENYSRYFDGRKPGDTPYTLLDFFPDDFITFIDESHMTLPQLRAMYNGDFARKKNLVDYGFRLPAAYDNRPLRFNEFEKKIGQLICVSATPSDYELEISDNVAEQLIRPTGLLDPLVVVKPIKDQVVDLLNEINEIIAKKGRILITTLTKKMAENLSQYLKEHNIKAEYMHSDIDTLDRVQLISDLRRGNIDVIVGINLLREGLDIPEVMLVAILDADKEGFLRSRTSLIQTIGRAARNAESKVILYADNMTKSMQEAIDETLRRRKKQDEYNKQHGIIPQTIKKDINNTLVISEKILESDKIKEVKTKKDLNKEIERLTKLMKVAAEHYDFELAIRYREQITLLNKKKNE